MDFKPGNCRERPHIHYLSNWLRTVRWASQNNGGEVIDAPYRVLGQDVLSHPAKVEPPVGGVLNGRVVEVQPVNKDVRQP